MICYWWLNSTSSSWTPGPPVLTQLSVYSVLLPPGRPAAAGLRHFCPLHAESNLQRFSACCLIITWLAASLQQQQQHHQWLPALRPVRSSATQQTTTWQCAGRGGHACSCEESWTTPAAPLHCVHAGGWDSHLCWKFINDNVEYHHIYIAF